MSLIEIKSDLFFISQRVKEIDDGYFICYNTNKKRFEVHNRKQPFSTFCLVVPKNKLNASLLEYVRKTRIENQKRLLEKMEDENRQIEQKRNAETIEKSAYEFEKICFNSKK